MFTGLHEGEYMPELPGNTFPGLTPSRTARNPHIFLLFRFVVNLFPVLCGKYSEKPLCNMPESAAIHIIHILFFTHTRTPAGKKNNIEDCHFKNMSFMIC